MAKKAETKSTKKAVFRPAAGYLLVEPEPKETRTSSGLYLPDSSEEKPQMGTVIMVGSPEQTEHGSVRKSEAEVGDRIVYKKWGGNEVNLNGKEYLFVKFEDILAIEK